MCDTYTLNAHKTAQYVCTCMYMYMYNVIYSEWLDTFVLNAFPMASKIFRH